jgi:hypothetical protein
LDECTLIASWLWLKGRRDELKSLNALPPGSRLPDAADCVSSVLNGIFNSKKTNIAIHLLEPEWDLNLGILVCSSDNYHVLTELCKRPQLRWRLRPKLLWRSTSSARANALFCAPHTYPLSTSGFPAPPETATATLTTNPCEQALICVQLFSGNVAKRVELDAAQLGGRLLLAVRRPELDPHSQIRVVLALFALPTNHEVTNP